MACGSILGRGVEQRAIDAFLSDRSYSALLLEGERGIGKTTLWRYGVERATRPLVCSGAPGETTASFAALGDLLEPVLGDALRKIPDPQRHALRVALLLDAPGQERPEPRAIGLATLNVLRAVSGAEPIVLAMDDLQWIDAPSVAALAFALRRLVDEPVRVFATVRVEPDAPPPMLAGALRPDRLARLQVGPLSIGALGRLLRDRLGASIPRPDLRRIHELSGGNPFYALELAQASLSVPGRSTRGIPVVPKSLHELLADRLRDLPPRTLDVLLAASLVSTPTPSLLATALDVPEAELGLEPALRARLLLEDDDDALSLAHPLIGWVVAREAAPGHKRHLHRRLASLVTDEEERVRHLAAAATGTNAALAEALDHAARSAAARGAPTTAAELSRLALDATPVGDRRHVRRGIDAARAKIETGALQRAETLLLEALEDAEAGPERSEVLWLLGSIAARRHGSRSAVGFYDAALVGAAKDEALLGRIHASLAAAFYDRCELSHASRHARAAAELAARSGDADLLAGARALEALVATMAGNGNADALMEHAPALGPDELLWIEPWSILARSLRLIWHGRLTEARESLLRVRRAAAERGSASEATCLSCLGLLECRAGNFTLAVEHAEEARELALETAHETRLPLCLVVLALAQARLGDAESAQAHAESVVELARQTGQTLLLAPGEGVLGFIELSLGNPAAAVEHLWRVVELTEELGIAEPGVFMFLPDAIEALVETGDHDHAELLVARLEEQGRRLDRALALACAARGRGILASVRGDKREATAAFEEALAQHDRVPMPFERAQTLLAQGAALRRARRRPAARRSLEDALSVFEELGARLWAAKAREELAAVPGRAARQHELTPAERRVAELVADGLANKEVASRLCVTVRTVETHLSHVYGKLGVRSRTELARKFSRVA